MADTPRTTPAVDWNKIWVALQELGAAMLPLEDCMPRGLRGLASALEVADRYVERKALEAESVDA